MRRAAVLCLLLLALVPGCGGGNDRPDLAAPPPTTETSATTPTTAQAGTVTHSATIVRTSVPLRRSQLRRIGEQARAAETAVQRWNTSIDACLGTPRRDESPGAICTREAWEQLFDQLYAVQYELLDLLDGMGASRCHDALAAVVDSVHGFLAGATPTKVVWLDEQQQPPSLYDLESIVDLVRPVAARLRRATMTACRS